MLWRIGIVFPLLLRWAGAGRNASQSDAMIPCYEDADCATVGGACERDFCKCNNSFVCKSPTVLVTKLGASCVSSADCNIDGSVCEQNRTCVCRDGFVNSDDGRNCLKLATGLGGNCLNHPQCYMKTPSSRCHENKCDCRQHMHPNGENCYKDVFLDEPCNLNEECSITPHASCKQNKCSCDVNYVSDGTSCLLKANGLNFSCTHDVQCRAQLGVGSECYQNTCRCNEMHHLKESSNQCVNDIMLNESCGQHSDCHQPGTGPSRLECIIGVCKCKSPYLEDSGYCINSSTHTVLFKSFMLFLGMIILVQ